MTKTRINKMAAVLLATVMTLDFLMHIPQIKVEAAIVNMTANFNKNYSLGSDPGQNIVNIAFAQQGRTGSQFGYYEDWCASFVSDCADLAGQSSAIPRTSAVNNEYSSKRPWWGIKQTILRAGGTTVSSPKTGDIIIFSGHVEIVTKVTNGTVYCIGGNNGGTGNPKTNFVKGERAAKDVGTVNCYLRPNYSGSANPPVQNNDTELGINYPRPSGSPYLQSGSTGSGVYWLQTALNKANNAGLAVDGQFGSGTKQAVINFQKANGLTADGIVGSATINKLVEVIKNKTNPIAPPKAPNVTITVDYNYNYMIFEFDKQENVDRYMAELGIVNGDVIISNSNLDNNKYKWKFEQTNAKVEHYLKITAVNNSGSSSTTKYFTILAACDSGHTYGSWTTIKSATCSSDGSEKRTCSVCGNSETRTISKTGNHSYGSWTTTKSPTCVSDGTEKRTCSVCGNSETRTISKTGNHSFGSETKDKDGNYVTICNVCGYKQVSPADEVTLSYDNVTGAPGETVKVNLYADTHGKKIHGACIGINYDKNNMELIDIDVVDLVYSTDSYFAACPAFMNISSGIVTFDSMFDIILNPKTTLLTYTFKISDTAKPGSYDIILKGSNGAKEPEFVCIENLNTYKAKLNLTVLKNAVTVKCKQHSFGSWSTTKEPTCTDDGIKSRKCTICGKTETESISPTEHSWSEWETIKEATCIENGEMTRKCSVCHDEEGTPIISTMHKYESTTVAPTYTENGYTLHKCSVCGDSYKDNYTKKLTSTITLTHDNVTGTPGDTVEINLYADSHGVPVKWFAFNLSCGGSNMYLRSIDIK